MRFSLLAGGLALLLVLAGGTVAFTLFTFNHFNEVEDRFDGSCTPVTGVAGPEDIEASPSSARAFVSSMDRRAGPAARGAIYSVLVDDPLDSENWRDRTAGVPEKFHPLGLNYFEQGDIRRLFVVNEATKAIEIYDVAKNGDLQHLESFTERRLTSPNDVVAVGLRSFYVTNDIEAGRQSWLGRFQFLSRSPTGKIYYYDGVAMRVAAEGLRFANGIALNLRKTRLYAAETSGQSLRIFDRDPETGVLTLIKVEPLPAAPDNINIAWDGALWIGAQPKPLSVPLVQRDRNAISPSLVIRYVDQEGVASPMTEVFSNKGDAISTASVAAISGSRLLIGALLDDKYLICDLPG
jgi:arylesterase/paraoxonase